MQVLLLYIYILSLSSVIFSLLNNISHFLTVTHFHSTIFCIIIIMFLFFNIIKTFLGIIQLKFVHNSQRAWSHGPEHAALLHP